MEYIQNNLKESNLADRFKRKMNQENTNINYLSVQRYKTYQGSQFSGSNFTLQKMRSVNHTERGEYIPFMEPSKSTFKKFP